MMECIVLHRGKSHDYASDDNPFSNFEFAARLADVTVDEVFMVMIGIKIARIKELMKKAPNFESRMDSHKDLITYSGIWAAWQSREGS